MLWHAPILRSADSGFVSSCIYKICLLQTRTQILSIQTDVPPDTNVVLYKHFGETWCLQIWPCKWKQFIYPKRWYLLPTLHGVISQKTNSDFFTAVKSSYLTDIEVSNQKLYARIASGVSHPPPHGNMWHDENTAEPFLRRFSWDRNVCSWTQQWSVLQVTYIKPLFQDITRKAYVLYLALSIFIREWIFLPHSVI